MHIIVENNVIMLFNVFGLLVKDISKSSLATRVSVE
jgi:hypothetical protein